MSVFRKCDDCSGDIVVGMFDTIKVPKLDDDGDVVLRADGEPETIRLRLPWHRANVPLSKFDPTGLVPAPCAHGLAQHPDPEVRASAHARSAVSWMRAKYIGIKKSELSGLPLPGCPLCHGEPRPDDLTTPANGVEVGELEVERRERLRAAQA